MQKLLPLWVLLLCLLLGSLFTLFFGWFVQKASHHQTRHERLGRAAIAVASFPDLVRESFRTIQTDADERVRVPGTGADLSGFQPIRNRSGIPIEGLMVRADSAALARAPGWRVVAGGFTLDGALENAALVLSPELEVVKVWKLVEKDIPGAQPHAANSKFVHGFTVLQDGSIIFGFDNGVSLQRFDACGKRIWAVPGILDHAVSLDESEQFVWTLDDSEKILKVSVADGAVVKRITMADIVAANPSIDILDIRQDDPDKGNDNSRQVEHPWLDDPFHLNDVEPLPATMAGAFKGFQAGDLLVSARSLNLIFVLDPETLRVRWWHSGSWRRQHDPDWQPTGEITVYDNRMNRDYSRIVGIVPGRLAGTGSLTPDVRVVFDGRTNDFYSRIRGKHQLTGAGTLLISSPQQGRVFEVERDGHGVFEMLNLRAGRHTAKPIGRGDALPEAPPAFNYPLSEAIWFPSDTSLFTEGVPCDKQLSSMVSP